ncbi:hypothetical protein [Pseudomonas chlororaphis]|uniref:hypothetical protein n=1 Tax=Pseudomonas chlororaphis TaxID=587753 RepID=UPI0015DE51D1|nr:hypothetical protein [Pseudomonas chlororaphis]QLL12563.1 hypothetical protein H0I86_26810 [Pseudomonas chlororaphis subsp. aurantiaca]
MLHIRATASCVPDAMTFRAVQAQEKNMGYGHLLYKAAAFALPRGRGKLHSEEEQRLLPSASIALPVALASQSAADMALAAVAQLQRQVPDALATVTHIVVTNAALNQRINESVAGRIQHSLKAHQALPFAIGQSGTAGVFNALMIIEALVKQNARVLLVASDKWLYPFFRSWGDLVAFGDGAAAILLDGDDATVSSQGMIHACAMHYGPAIDNPWQLSPAALADKLHPLAVNAIRAVLDRCGYTSGDIDWVLPAGFSDSFTLGVSHALGMTAEQHFKPNVCAHQSSAGPLLALQHLQTSLPAGQTATALLWDAALCGSAGAMVVKLKGCAAAATAQLSGKHHVSL